MQRLLVAGEKRVSQYKLYVIVVLHERTENTGYPSYSHSRMASHTSSKIFNLIAIHGTCLLDTCSVKCIWVETEMDYLNRGLFDCKRFLFGFELLRILNTHQKMSDKTMLDRENSG